ncbi:MAG: DUF1330 domain-containing protein [Dehalococcoidia bacterium]|nr:DUF1330 domain-containing protein [Dehalococcoidia bacterium]
MPERVLLVVLLYAYPGQEAALRAFETQALRILREHGGELLAAQSPRTVVGADLSAPTEVHVVTFPDEAALAAYRADPRLAALAAYRADPRLAALAAYRAAAIERTVVISGDVVEPHSGSEDSRRANTAAATPSSADSTK